MNISIEIARRFKRAGFSKPVPGYYVNGHMHVGATPADYNSYDDDSGEDEYVSAPDYIVAADWLNEYQGIEVALTDTGYQKKFKVYDRYSGNTCYGWQLSHDTDTDVYNRAVEYALNMFKNKFDRTHGKV